MFISVDQHLPRLIYNMVLFQHKCLLFSTCIKSAMTADGLKFMMLHVANMISAPEMYKLYKLLVSLSLHI